MTNIIVVFPKLEDAKAIKTMLVRNGFTVVAVCTTGAQALNSVSNLNDGIIVSGYKLADMLYSELHDYLPPYFEMLLIASSRLLSECKVEDIVCLSMPLKLHDLVNTVNMMAQSLVRRRKKRKEKPRQKSDEEIATIDKAKKILMERNNMTESEAHRYIQKCSMDSGNNMLETAWMIITIMMN